MQETEASPKGQSLEERKLALMEAVLLLEQEERSGCAGDLGHSIAGKHPCQAIGDWVSAQWECGAQATLSRSTTSYPTRHQTR